MRQILPSLLAALVAALIMNPLAAHAGGSTPPPKGTKYPIVLAHGAFGFDELAGIEYFYKIAAALEKDGNTVFTTEVPAFNTPIARGNILADQIEEILAITGAQKVIIIGHSNGGIDARYATTHRLGASKVAAVVSIASPHRGAEFANSIAGIFGGGGGVPGGALGEAVISFMNFLGFAINGNSELPQDAAAALFYMSPAGMSVFNDMTPNVSGVKYWSYAGTRQSWISLDLFDPILALLGSIAHSGPNDGFVSVASARWGEEKNLNLNANHLDEVNHLLGNTGWWDAESFYRDVARQLRDQGL
ncbi:MAG: alpha/beta fold hydrolase [Chrysiogenetes bacterium]|nr:alpha/beta fold hydrolase [Chrysiogenetes bacterium]